MSPSAPLAIEADGLRKVYGTFVAVDSLSLRVAPGTVFGFLGPNGAGKTTSIKMLLGLVAPTAGTARLLGRDLHDLEVKRRIGFLPEHYRFHEWLTATEFLDFHGRLYHMPGELRRRRIPEVLKQVGLGARAGDRLRTFSKGMLQRAGLAQALLNEPALVFLDEPTSGLDPVGRREVRDIIKHLQERGATVFLNSHILGEIEMTCQEVAIMDRGRVVRAGPLDELLAGALDVDLEIRGLGPELLADLRRLSTRIDVRDGMVRATVPGEDVVPRLAEAVMQHGAELYRLTPRRESLEDLFVSLVEGREG